MSDATDFLGSGGGGVLGLEPPKPSQTFKEPGALGCSNSLAGRLQGSGRRAPLSGTDIDHITLPIMLNVGSTGQKITRGTGQGTVVWQLDMNTDKPTQDADYFGRAYWYDQINNNLYFLSQASSSNQVGASAIQKIDCSDGTWTQLCSFNGGVAHNNYGEGNTIYPVTPATPDASDWIVIYPEYGTAYRMVVKTFNSAGVQYGGNDYLKYSRGLAEENTLGFLGGYITADRTMLMGSPKLAYDGTAGTETIYLSFPICRGAVRTLVSVPFDGSLPVQPMGLVNTSIAISNPTDTLLTAWGDSVLFLADASQGETVTKRTIFGRRLFDRVDFDRWLQEVADYFSLPAAEEYFS